MKNADIELLTGSAGFAHTLGSAPRLQLLEQIAQGEFAVEQLVALTGLSVANTSQHLQQLRRAGFVQARRDGKRVLYRLGGGPILEVLAALGQFAEHNRLAVRELLADSMSAQERLEAMSRDELVQRLHEQSITLLDVRSHEEYALGHLPGAISMPLDELQQRLAELPQDQEIVAYCRGPWCVLSSTATAALREHGFKVRRLDSGLPDWQAAGLPVEA